MRERSAAFPMELARRLILMYSLYGDTVLDPFAGTGTALLAAAALGRNSVGIDIDGSFGVFAASQFDCLLSAAEEMIGDRIAHHHAFVAERPADKSPLNNVNRPHGFPVMTKQETELVLRNVVSVKQVNQFEYIVGYEDIGVVDIVNNGIDRNRKGVRLNAPMEESGQMSLDI